MSDRFRSKKGGVRERKKDHRRKKEKNAFLGSLKARTVLHGAGCKKGKGPVIEPK